MNFMKLLLLTVFSISASMQAMHDNKQHYLLTEGAYQQYTQCRILMQDPLYLMRSAHQGDARCLNTHMFLFMHAAASGDKASYMAAAKIMIVAEKELIARNEELHKLQGMIQAQAPHKELEATIETMLK